MKTSSETPVDRSGSGRVLIIMAKAPRPGNVKTRLTPGISPTAVTDLYWCLLEDTLSLARSLSDVEVAIVCPESDVNELTKLAGGEAIVVAQKGDGLAAGLTSAFAHFLDGRQRSTIAFNSDSPHLPPSIIKDAFEMLASRDVVVENLGPGCARTATTSFVFYRYPIGATMRSFLQNVIREL